MSNYQSPKPRRINYRKIYPEHYGPIPIDEEGRKYDIHHIDGDHTNNDPNNLQAVPIKEHFAIHRAMKDWRSCHAIALRMKISPEEKSELARKAAYAQIAAGTHNFSDPEKRKEFIARRKANGRHPWLGGKIQREVNQRKLLDGTHHLLDGGIQREAALKRMAEGTDNTQRIHTCPICMTTGKGPRMFRYHFSRCTAVTS